VRHEKQEKTPQNYNNATGAGNSTQIDRRRDTTKCPNQIRQHHRRFIRGKDVIGIDNDKSSPTEQWHP
jgi:hypothetical protein